MSLCIMNANGLSLYDKQSILQQMKVEEQIKAEYIHQPIVKSQHSASQQYDMRQMYQLKKVMIKKLKHQFQRSIEEVHLKSKNNSFSLQNKQLKNNSSSLIFRTTATDIKISKNKKKSSNSQLKNKHIDKHLNTQAQSILQNKHLQLLDNQSKKGSLPSLANNAYLRIKKRTQFKNKSYNHCKDQHQNQQSPKIKQQKQNHSSDQHKQNKFDSKIKNKSRKQQNQTNKSTVCFNKECVLKQFRKKYLHQIKDIQFSISHIRQQKLPYFVQILEQQIKNKLKVQQEISFLITEQTQPKNQNKKYKKLKLGKLLQKQNVLNDESIPNFLSKQLNLVKNSFFLNKSPLKRQNGYKMF